MKLVPSEASLDNWSAVFSLKALLLASSILFVLAALLGSDWAGASEEELLISWEDEDHTREYDANAMHAFNFTIQYNGTRPGVLVAFRIDVTSGGISGFVSSEEEMDIIDWKFRYLRGKQYDGAVMIYTSQFVPNGTHWLNVTLYIDDDEDVANTTCFGVIMRQFADFTFYVHDPPPGGFGAAPPDPITVRIALHNLGNGYDSFLVNATFQGEAPQWGISYVSGTDADGQTPIVPPDQTLERRHVVDIRLTPTGTMLADATYQLVVDVRSMFDPAMVVPPIYVRVTALQRYEFKVQVTPSSSQEGLPGKDVEFQIVVENLGNGRDNFTISPLWNTTANPGFDVEVDPSALGVQALEVGVARYVVKVPEMPPRKTYFFRLEVLSSSPDLPPVGKNLSVIIGGHFRLDLTTEESTRGQTIPGGSLEFGVVLRNKGNVLDSVKMEATIDLPDDWRIDIQPKEATLLPNQESLISIVVKVSSRFDKAPIGTYTMNVSAASSRSDARTELALEVEVIRFHRVEWADPDDIPARHLNPYEKVSFSYSRELSNLGNGRELVGLDWYSPTPGIELSLHSREVQLDLSETRPVRFDISVDLDLPPDIYTVYLNATPQGPEAVPRVLTIYLKVVHYDASVPSIPTVITPDVGDVVRGPYKIELDANMSFKLKVENNGTAALKGVEFKAFDVYWVDGREVRWNFFNFTTTPIAVGDRFIVGERPYKEGNPPIFWWTDRTGNHTLEFRVYYPFQSNTDNDVARLNVTVVKAHDVEGGDDGTRPSIGLMAIVILVCVVIITTALGLHAWVGKDRGPRRPR